MRSVRDSCNFSLRSSLGGPLELVIVTIRFFRQFDHFFDFLDVCIFQLCDDLASSKSKRNGEREASDKSFKIFKRERVVTPLPF